MKRIEATIAAVEVRIGMGLGNVMRRLRPHGLFGKYALTIVSLVVFVLMVNGAIEAYIIYSETTSRLAQAQKDAAWTIAGRANAFLLDLDRNASFVTRASSMTMQDHRKDYLSLLQQCPQVSALTFVDGDGRPRLKVARDQVLLGNGSNIAAEPTATESAGRSSWFSPAVVQDGKPLLVLNMAHAGDAAGVTVVHIDLAKVLAFVGSMPLPADNYAYVIDSKGKVIASSKDSLIAVGSDLGTVASIKSLLKDGSVPDAMSTDAAGRAVLRTGAPIETTNWAAVVEEPTRDALWPLSEFAFRFAWLLAFGSTLAILAGLVLSRRMINPIKALQGGATHLAANEFDHRIEVRTGDELEELAAQFNRMAGELANSYGRLELQVEERTRDLALSVRELKALEEIGRALASSLDLPAVLAAIVSRAVEFTNADAGAIYALEDGSSTFHLAEAQGFPLDLRTAASTFRGGTGGALEAALTRGKPVLIADLATEQGFPARERIVATGFRSALVVGLIGSGEAYGALVMYWRQADSFHAGTSGVMQTFAHQSVLAMHNARLFQELVDRGRQLEVANAHRTQFFANMSHELRTPLNAVLGYSELLYDGLYGVLPDRAVGVIDRIQANSKHLLGLINDVLDMTKMEAGALSLSLNDYSVKGLVEGVFASTESLAKTKGLTFEASVPDGLPIGHGDDRRLMQVLLNLVGNAIKFTDQGSVRIEASLADGYFHIAVRDTGPGISPEGQQRIFEEFQQIDDASTRKKGGTGLGLSISRRLVLMHGGRIEVASVAGEGATFTVVVPVQAEEQRSAA